MDIMYYSMFFFIKKCTERVERFVDAMNARNNEIIDVEFSVIKDN